MEDDLEDYRIYPEDDDGWRLEVLGEEHTSTVRSGVAAGTFLDHGVTSLITRPRSVRVGA